MTKHITTKLLDALVEIGWGLGKYTENLSIQNKFNDFRNGNYD